jgi:hypothetical protein
VLQKLDSREAPVLQKHSTGRTVGAMGAGSREATGILLKLQTLAEAGAMGTAEVILASTQRPGWKIPSFYNVSPAPSTENV